MYSLQKEKGLKKGGKLRGPLKGVGDIDKIVANLTSANISAFDNFASILLTPICPNINNEPFPPKVPPKKTLPKNKPYGRGRILLEALLLGTILSF